jgi:D-alanyl-lipoteichoic acid acyltransferase DltB (MBOAT superfamily)
MPENGCLAENDYICGLKIRTSMLFNSVDYLLFFPVVVALYFAFPVKWRWLLLLLASYFFYMVWKAEYVVLIMITTIIDYLVAIRISEARSKKLKKQWLVLSVIVNLGMLAGFKYLNFLSGSMNWLFGELDVAQQFPVFNILLPVGISFYIFQSLSYTIDVYRGSVQPERHAGKFALYVSFFPQLVAGPIERSSNLLPQIHETHSFSQQRLVSGLKLMLWGFFKKVVIADRLGLFVGKVYDSPEMFNGFPIILATVLFAFQLYCDFSGYTDIARGSARVMGFDLMINFNRPMIAKSLREFWNRWHISLTTWFRDYLLYSLPYIKNKKIIMGLMYRNLIITYLLMGLWHGASWTFVIFGLFHGILLVLETITERQRNRLFEVTRLNNAPFLKTTLSIAVTFSILAFSLVFFRSATITGSWSLITNAFDFSNFGSSIREILKDNEVLFGMLMVIFLLMAEYLHEKHNLVKIMASRHVVLRWSVYISFIFFVLLFGVLHKQAFIYFQF